jgi:hypothetical protein
VNPFRVSVAPPVAVSDEFADVMLAAALSTSVSAVPLSAPIPVQPLVS